jgi:hypothetical protein
MSDRGRGRSKSRRRDPGGDAPQPAGAVEAKEKEEEDVEDAHAQAPSVTHGMAASAAPSIEEVIPIFALSENHRQTIVEIVSMFPNLSEKQLTSIEKLVVSNKVMKQSIISLVVSGAAISASGSTPVLSAEQEKKVTAISNSLSKHSDEKINEKLRPIMKSLADAGKSNVGGSVAFTQEHSKRLDDAFEKIFRFQAHTQVPSATLSNLCGLTPAGAAKLLGRNSLSSYGGSWGEADTASSASSPSTQRQQVQFHVPETLKASEKRREQREKDGNTADLTRSNLPDFITNDRPLNQRLEALGTDAYEDVRLAAFHLAAENATNCHVQMTSHTLQTYMIVAEVNKQIHRFFTLGAELLVTAGYSPARSILDNLGRLKEQDEELRPDITCLSNAYDMAAFHLAGISGLYYGASGSIFRNGFDSTALSRAACLKVAEVWSFNFGDDVTDFQSRLTLFVESVEQAQKNDS